MKKETEGERISKKGKKGTKEETTTGKKEEREREE